MARSKPANAELSLTLEREPFLASLTLAASFSPGKSPHPILKYVKLDWDGKQIKLTATDLENTIELIAAGLDGSDSPSAAVLLPPKLLPIIGAMQAEQVSIHVADGKLSIDEAGGASHYDLDTVPAGEFPNRKPATLDGQCVLSGAAIAKVMQRTAFACDAESSRYALGGVCISGQPDNDALTFVATDGRRMVWMPTLVDADVKFRMPEPGPIVPQKSCKAIPRALGRAETVRFGVTQSEAVFATDDCTIAARLIEGRFPRWRDVVPDIKGSAEVEFVTAPLVHALRQAALITNNETRGVKWTLSRGQLRLGAVAAELGAADVKLPCTFNGSEAITVTLDPRFVLEFLDQLEPADVVAGHFRDAESPVLFVAGEYRSVVMPLSTER